MTPDLSQTPFRIGIDLGTTNTCAAFADGRIPRIIPTEKGHNYLASVVAFNNGQMLIGAPARDQLLLQPENTIYGAKRLIGRPYYSQETQHLMQLFTYKIVENQHRGCSALIDGKEYELEDIAALLLKQIINYAEVHTKKKVEGAVIAVPANFSYSQRAAIKIAAQKAGLELLRLINEPTAAALSYGLSRQDGRKILIYDFGGGTFDVSIIEANHGIFQVLATGGDAFLGGFDFDTRLCQFFLKSFTDEHGINLSEDATVVQRFLLAAEHCKISLSALQHFNVQIPFVTQQKDTIIDFEYHLSREKYESLCADLLYRSMSIVDETLQKASLKAEDIDDVVLAGGQTRMPLIQEQLHQKFAQPPRRGVHPEEVVAQGAALLARSLGKENDFRLLDILSIPIGIALYNDSSCTDVHFKKVINSDDHLPQKVMVSVQNYRIIDTKVQIDLYQGAGETLDTAEYINSVFYQIPVERLNQPPTIFLEFSMDVEGCLTLTAHHGDPRQSKTLTLSQEIPLQQNQHKNKSFINHKNTQENTQKYHIHKKTTEEHSSKLETSQENSPTKKAGLFSRLFKF